MRKLALISAAVMALGTIGLSGGAQAQDYGAGYRGGAGGYGARGRAVAPYANRGGRSYGYRGERRGISTGAAVGLGVAGLAAGAIAADAARRNGYGYGAPAYGYGAPGGYDDGY